MKELINLKIDYAFKLIFGKEGNEAILIAFLNAALRLPQKSRIDGITIMSPELNKEYHDDKKSILDVRAMTIEGMQINIEIVKRHVAVQNCLWVKSCNKVKAAEVINL